MRFKTGYENFFTFINKKRNFRGVGISDINNSKYRFLTYMWSTTKFDENRKFFYSIPMTVKSCWSVLAMKICNWANL